MKRLEKILLFLTVVFSFICLMSTYSIAADSYMNSGDLNTAKPTKEEIKNMWETLSVAHADTLLVPSEDEKYDVKPSVSAPYSTGTLSQEFLKNGIDYLNFVRFAANLPTVQLSDDLNQKAQHGAVLLAANDVLTHYPEQPSDMSDSFYSEGYSSTTSSNISVGYLSLEDSLYGCLQDSGTNNLATVGHRRWLLNPTLLNVGFGHADYYTTTQVFDESGSGIDYDFISYPASGYFPSNLFSKYAPWSVTVNPGKYYLKDVNEITVTLSRESDGSQWVFNSDTPGPVDNATPFMCVDLNGYGVANCIIFSFGGKDVLKYWGTYTVKVEGFYLRETDESAPINYQVEFFDANNCLEHDFILEREEPTCTNDGETYHLCSVCGEFKGDRTVIPATGHKSDKGVISKAATYTHEGVKTYSCTVCKKTLKEERIPKLVGSSEAKGEKTELAKVTGVKAKTLKANSVKLTWTAVSGATGYDVYYSTNGKKWTKKTTTKNSITVKKLKAGTKYKFKVVAVSGGSSSEESEVFTTATKPAKVTLKSVKSTKAKRAVVVWNTVKGANGYQVTYSTSKKFTKKTTKSVTVKKQKTKKTTLKKLKSGKKYFIKVRAYKTVNGKKIYGAYSKVNAVKIK